MITLGFEDINSVFHGKVEAYDFLELTDEEIAEFEASWLKAVGGNPYVRRLFSTYRYDSENQIIEFEMRYPIDDDIDAIFTTEILALGMCVEWLTPKVNSLDTILQVYGSKEEKYYSQSQHLKEIRSLRDSMKVQQRKMIRDRGYAFNSYIEGYGDIL